MHSIRRWLAAPPVLRYLGLAGAVGLAVTAWLGGAFPDLVTGHVTFETVAGGPNGAVIVTLWFLGTAAMCLAWWYGRHLVGRGRVTARWVLVTAVLWMVPFAVSPPIGSRDVYAYACQGALVAAGHSPYVEGVSALPCQWLGSVSPIWRDTPAPYGPLFLTLAGLAASLGSQLAAIVAFRALMVVGIAGIAVALPVLARRNGVPADRALWLVLACPLVPVHVIGGIHNDALVVAFLVAGFAVLADPARRMSALVVGGALIGASVSVKVTIGVVLPFAALFAAGAPHLGPLRETLRKAGVVMASGLGTLVAFSFASGLGLGWVTALSHAGDSIAWSSPPTALGLAVSQIAGRPAWDAVPAVRAVALVALPIALLLILWHSRDHDPLYGAGLALFAVIFLAPIDQPWYLIWPLTMFAVTRVAARWLAGAVVFTMFWVMPDGTGLPRRGPWPMTFVMVGLIGWVAVRFWAWMRGAEPKMVADSALVGAEPAG